MKRVKWIKGKNGDLWTTDSGNKEIYNIFDTGKKDTKYAIGIFRNCRVKRNGTLTGSKSLFYDGFNLNKAKQIVKEIIKLNNKVK